MKRIGVFVLIGPILGLVMILILTARVSLPRPNIHISAYFLIFAYLASLAPAIVSAFADLLLATKSWRVLGAACAGAIAAVLEMMLLHGYATILQLLAFAIFGAIPAAVCSVLSGARTVA
jgi:hypothetical protein